MWLFAQLDVLTVIQPIPQPALNVIKVMHLHQLQDVLNVLEAVVEVATLETSAYVWVVLTDLN